LFNIKLIEKLFLENEIHDVLTNNIIDSIKYKIYDDYTTSKFYNDYFTKVLTINFINMTRATDENDPFKCGDFTSYIFGLFDNLSNSSIKTSALYINNKLVLILMKEIFIINGSLLIFLLRMLYVKYIQVIKMLEII